MKYFIIAGEASGDMHGANLMHNILSYDNDAQFRFFGGDMMKNIGGTMVKHYREMAFMGIGEVLMHARRISRNLSLCRKSIIDYQPDVIILVDYAGFNLRIAKFAKNHNFRVYYYILPKLWAWGKSRIGKIKKYTDRLFVILPFEVKFYKQYNIKVEYFGNPLIDQVNKDNAHSETSEEFRRRNALSDKSIIALLAGSRKQEIHRCLPRMAEIVKYFPGYQFVVAGLSSIEDKYYKKALKNNDIRVIYNQTYPLLSKSSAAVVTSGTATLETALFNVPQTVIYKTSPFTYYFGQILVLIKVIHVKFFSLVNIILDKEAVKEFLQFQLSKNIKKELDIILTDEKYRYSMLQDYKELKDKIGKPGVSERVAEKIVNSLSD